jgi:hypothetical protein
MEIVMGIAPGKHAECPAKTQVLFAPGFAPSRSGIPPLPDVVVSRRHTAGGRLSLFGSKDLVRQRLAKPEMSNVEM